MSTKSNDTNEREKLLATIVFASVVFSIFAIAADELTTTNQNALGLFSWLRVPLGIYIGIFPVGYLAMAFLFPEKDIDSIERFGLAIALSISINVITILLANMFLAFPITLARNALIIFSWSIVFYLLFLFRASFVPLAREFWEEYDWEFSERQKRFAWLKLFDLVLFSSLLAALTIAIGVITRPGQPFNGIAGALSPAALAFLFLFPSGYFLLYAFVQRKERSGLANLLLVLLLSLPVHLASAAILLVFWFFTGTSFTVPKLMLVSFAIDCLLYAFIFLSERIMPVIYYWLDRRQKLWK